MEFLNLPLTGIVKTSTSKNSKKSEVLSIEQKGSDSMVEFKEAMNSTREGFFDSVKANTLERIRQIKKKIKNKLVARDCSFNKNQ